MILMMENKQTDQQSSGNTREHFERNIRNVYFSGLLRSPLKTFFRKNIRAI